MIICEIHNGVQGEGVLIGVPAIFIRVYGCSNSCKYCDTPYSWDASSPEAEKYSMSSEEIIKKIEEINSDGKVNHWVFTGGEPTLQMPAFIELLEAWKKTGKNIPTFEVETNGKQKPINLGEFDKYLLSYNVSPKLSRSMDGSKQQTFNHRIKEDAMKAFVADKRATFKFVASDNTDMVEVKEIQKFFKIPNHRVMLMPLGKTIIELNAVQPWLINYCVTNNYRFAPRLHIMLFNGKRGV